MQASEAETLRAFRPWCYKVAGSMLGWDHPDVEDLAQEGWIAMWRALSAYDSGKGSLPSWLTGAARLRMRDVAWGAGQWFGHEAVRGVREVVAGSVDPADLPDLAVPCAELAAVDEMDSPLAEALASLTPPQRRYVHARFVCGIESRRHPDLAAAVPELAMHHLWHDRNGGARVRLARALTYGS